MGFELVSLVYRIEEEFEIIIPDEKAERMTIPRDVIDYISSIPSVSSKWSRGYIEVTVWLAIEDELCVDQKDFNLDSRFVQDMGAA